MLGSFMINRIRNWIFGTRFVCFQYAYETYTRRVRYNKCGKPYIVCWGDMIELNDDMTMTRQPGGTEHYSKYWYVI